MPLLRWTRPDEVRCGRPSACVWRSGYWFEPEEQIKKEPQRLASGVPSLCAPPTGLDQTKLGVGAPAPAPNAVVTVFESRRENGKASELRSEAFSLAPPTGLEPVTLRLTVECSAN